MKSTDKKNLFSYLGDNAVLKTTVRTDIKGRLLTPEEGCGYSKVANTRIVGGAPAKRGEFKQSYDFLEASKWN